MKPTYSEIFAALGNVDPEVVSLLESLVVNRSVPQVGERGASELLFHARSIASRLEAARRLDVGQHYEIAEFVAALRAEIAAKPSKTSWCPPVLAAFEARLATLGIEIQAA